MGKWYCVRGPKESKVSGKALTLSFETVFIRAKSAADALRVYRESFQFDSPAIKEQAYKDGVLTAVPLTMKLVNELGPAEMLTDYDDDDDGK